MLNALLLEVACLGTDDPRDLRQTLRACTVDFLQITNDMIDRSRHKEDYHIERIYRTMNFQQKEGLSKDDLITFLGVCGKHYRKEDIESLINRIDPWFVIE